MKWYKIFCNLFKTHLPTPVWSNSEIDYWDMKFSAVVCCIMEDKFNACNSTPTIDYSMFDYSDGKFHCPYIPLVGNT